jgi:hypothetical protein
VTAGAAVATGSAALHHHLEHDRWPTPAGLWRTFRRGLLPGLAATAVAVAFAVLFAVDLFALRRGVVPGGTPMIVVTVALAVAVAGFAALVVVALGARDAVGWRGAVRATAATVSTRPMLVPAVGGVVALAGLLSLLVHPALTPVLLGHALFAVHAVVRRDVTRSREPRRDPRPRRRPRELTSGSALPFR